MARSRRAPRRARSRPRRAPRRPWQLDPTSTPASERHGGQPARAGSARWVRRQRRSEVSSSRRGGPSITAPRVPSLACVGRDLARLDHRRFHPADGRVGLHAGSDRRRAVTGRLRRRRLRRLAARPAASSRRARSSPYAPLSALVGALLIGGILASAFEVLGFHLRRRLGERLGSLDGVGGAVLRGLRRAGPRLDRRCGGAQHPRRARAARADPALGDPERAQRACCRRRARSSGARALRSVPERSSGRGRDVPPPNSAIARDPDVRARRPQRREGAGHRVRPGGAGLGLGRRATASW